MVFLFISSLLVSVQMIVATDVYTEHYINMHCFKYIRSRSIKRIIGNDYRGYCIDQR